MPPDLLTDIWNLCSRRNQIYLLGAVDFMIHQLHVNPVTCSVVMYDCWIMDGAAAVLISLRLEASMEANN